MPLDESLMCMKALGGASEKVDIDIDGPHEYRDFKIAMGNGNSMDCFPNERFDAVVCNAVFEHDKYFWKSLSEMKRVDKPGALIVIGVPGYAKLGMEKIKGILTRTPVLRRLYYRPFLGMFFTATPTFQIHNWPGDYYRFSVQTVREVFLEELEKTDVRTLLSPPRIIGVGNKPAKM